MELDTGAAVSKHTRNTYFPSLGLTPCSLALRTYTAQTIPVLGEAHMYKLNTKTSLVTLPLYVIEGNGPDLIGRDWLSAIQGSS